MLQVPNELQVFRNSTGHIIKVEGVSWKILEWISAAHKNTTYIIDFWVFIHTYSVICVYFSYRFNVIPFNPLFSPLDASGDKPGILNLVGKGVCKSYKFNFFSLKFKKKNIYNRNTI